MRQRKFVFGMGTGCCGTASLAFLLNSQPSSFVGHELFPKLEWSTSENARGCFIRDKWHQLNHESHLYDLVGDVASYYLPYVRFLLNNMATNQFYQHDITMKFIILHRNKSEVIQSFLQKFQRQGNNPLQLNSAAKRDEWDHCFPKFEDMPLELAISKYYDGYYREAETLVKIDPRRVRIYDIGSMNTESGVRSILDFLEIQNQNIIVGNRKNKERAK